MIRHGMAENGYEERLQRSIDFIEENLRGEMALSDISRQANASLYHFHRLFRAFVGESLSEYVRHRRLNRAAEDLVGTKKSVIEIALDYGYSAPESFLRAFKAMYGMPPRDFRRLGRLPAVHGKAELVAEGRREIKGGIEMEPVMRGKSPFTLFGELIHTSHGACKIDTAGLWARERESRAISARARKEGAESLYGVCFGLCDGCGLNPEGGPDKFPYLIGWEAREGAPVPAGLVEMKVPGGKYAVFTIEGGGKDIHEAVSSIYGSWLPGSSFELSDSPVLEKYPADWTGSPDSTMEIWLPVKMGT
jgi:AraC family transcriptional regulator